MAGDEPERALIACREYGAGSTTLVVLHGGPGAPGSLASVARGLAEARSWAGARCVAGQRGLVGGPRVLEPLQRRSGGEPLTVAGHVADLEALLAARCGEQRPIVLGHSWGAMLALAHAAAHPSRPAALVLVGCGTFDSTARAELVARREARLDGEMASRLDQARRAHDDPDARLAALGALSVQIDSVDPIAEAGSTEACDARGYEQTWKDALRCQAEGLHPAAFAAIDVPVLMLHGEQDSHPGALIRDSLRPCLPQLQYHAWAGCGHYPWLERAVGDQFFARVLEWVAELPAPAGHRAV